MKSDSASALKCRGAMPAFTRGLMFGITAIALDKRFQQLRAGVRHDVQMNGRIASEADELAATRAGGVREPFERRIPAFAINRRCAETDRSALPNARHPEPIATSTCNGVERLATSRLERGGAGRFQAPAALRHADEDQGTAGAGSSVRVCSAAPGRSSSSLRLRPFGQHAL